MDQSEDAHYSAEQLKRWFHFEGSLEDSDPPSTGDSGIETHLESCEQCAAILETVLPDRQQMVVRLRELAAAKETDETLIDPLYLEPRESFSDSTSSHSAPLLRDRWTLLNLLTVGGIGEIWVARDELLGRKVAVKRLRKETAGNPMIRRRFLYEAKITAQLNHPGTVHIFDLVEDGPRSFYSMTLIGGSTLHQKVTEYHQRKNVSRVNNRAELFELMRHWVSVARTIAFAHSQSVLHRDIKSENIIVGDFGEVTVVDWGIAKRFSDKLVPAEQEDYTQSDSVELSRATLVSKGHLGVRETRLGVRLGTPAFMAPEQARGDVRAIDQRTDTYGLAALLYEILTGRTPFEANGVETMMDQVLNGKLIAPKDWAPEVPDRLSDICLKGLARDPDERFQRASDFADTLEKWMNSERLKEQTDEARQKLFELSSDLMVMFDTVPKILWVNGAWERELGWSLDDMLGLKPNILVHPDDLEADNQVFLQVRKGQTITGLERRVQSSSGIFHWFSWTVTPIVDEGITVAIGRNIDDLVRRRDELAGLLEEAPEAIIVVNLDRTIYRVNKKVSSMFGYSEAEMIGESIKCLSPTQYQQSLLRFFDSFLDAPTMPVTTEQGQLLGRHKDGNQFELSIRLKPIEINGTKRIVSSIHRV